MLSRRAAGGRHTVTASIISSTRISPIAVAETTRRAAGKRASHIPLTHAPSKKSIKMYTRKAMCTRYSGLRTPILSSSSKPWLRLTSSRKSSRKGPAGIRIRERVLSIKRMPRNMARREWLKPANVKCGTENTPCAPYRNSPPVKATTQETRMLYERKKRWSMSRQVPRSVAFSAQVIRWGRRRIRTAYHGLVWTNSVRYLPPPWSDRKTARP